MGQKVHPYGLRLGINKPWKSRWFVERGYDKLLVEDVKLKAELQKRTSREVFIDILEVNKPELDAQLVAVNIALQLEKRVSFRRAMRKSVDSALRFGCKGIKVRVSGRLKGNEIAARGGTVRGGCP